MIQGHPTTWVGRTFKHKDHEGEYKVLEVVKNYSRYSVKLDTDNDYMRYLGYDSRAFKKHWAEVKETNTEGARLWEEYLNGTSKDTSVSVIFTF